MKIAYTGDLVLQEIDGEPEYIFEDIKDLTSSENINLCINLESPFITKGMNAQKNKITLGTAPESKKHLKYLAPYLVNLSNNHTNDYGNTSSKLTCEILDTESLSFFGINYPNEKGNVYYDDTLKIIQIAFTDRSSDLTGTKLFGEKEFIGPYPPESGLIETLKKEHRDYSVIVNIHWGTEDITYPEPEKRTMAYEMINAGADLIVGHHPHIVQPIEEFNGKLIFYSLGNLYFPDIHYCDKNNNIRLKRSKSHQKKGIIPVFEMKEGKISLKEIYATQIHKKGKLIVKRHQKSIMLPKNGKFYIFAHRLWYGLKDFSRRSYFVMKNPGVIFRKLKTMKKIINSIYSRHKLGRIVFFIPKYVIQWYKNTIMSDSDFVKMRYRQKLGVKLNLKNPKTFTEKMQWLKIYDRNPLYTICADKFNVREFVAERIKTSHLIPLIFASNTPENIPFETLPAEYIIKTNHTSGFNMIVKNNTIKYFSHEETFCVDRVKKILQSWLKMNVFYENREWEYKNIKPMIIIEELLKDESGNELLNDYKIHCFDGKPTYIQTIFDRLTGIKENWFDTAWNPIELHYFSPEKKSLNKPPNLRDLLSVASKLSKGFNYVRVDLYSINNKVYFGELTFHPYSGLMRFVPEKWDHILGELVKRPKQDE